MNKEKFIKWSKAAGILSLGTSVAGLPELKEE